MLRLPTTSGAKQAWKTRPENPGGQEGRKKEKNSEQGYLAASSLLAVSLDSLFGMTQNLSNG